MDIFLPVSDYQRLVFTAPFFLRGNLTPETPGLRNPKIWFACYALSRIAESIANVLYEAEQKLPLEAAYQRVNDWIESDVIWD